MTKKKIFLVFIAISCISFLLQYGGNFSWMMGPHSCASSGHKPKQTNIVFLKTHKTASTTMQNLLFRFAERNNLTVALPTDDCHHMTFCYPKTFNTSFVHPHTLPANIVTNHMRFSRDELRRLMPSDTAYVTILREPVSLFESLFGYYNQFSDSFKRVPYASLEVFLNKPWHYYWPEEPDSMYARNIMTFDLGGNKDWSPLDKAYARFVAEVEDTFSLVMITEHFDESLVLLRHLFSWDLEDVLYIKQNMRMPGTKRSLSPNLHAKVRIWNSLDTHLYQHFNASLWRRLTALGLECVEREVQLIRRANEKLMRSCFGGRLAQLRHGDLLKNKDLRPWRPSPNVHLVGYDLPSNGNDSCLKLIMPELQYIRVLLRQANITSLD